MKNTAIKISLLVLLTSIGGCAAHKVAGHWRDDSVVADGNDREWPDSPQYQDDDRQLAIWVTNNTTIISLCVVTSQADLTRRPRMGGLTVWFDPQGGEKHVFGIHLPGGERDSFARQHGRPVPGGRPRDRQAREPANEPPPLEQLAVTYADTTGPLTMSIAEVRRTGIDIGVGRAGTGRLAYEFNIAFRAAPSLCDLKPGMVVGIGILIGGFAWNSPAGFDRGLGGPGLGSSMGGIPGARGFARKDKPFELWLQVRLAEGVTGSPPGASKPGSSRECAIGGALKPSRKMTCMSAI